MASRVSDSAAVVDAPPPAWRRYAVLALKLAIAAVVVVAAGGAVRDAWTELSTQQLTVDYRLAVASAAMLFIGQAPMAWYWRRTMLALDQPAPPNACAAAYYFSQIGKYAPGKGMVVLLRTQYMLRHGGRGRTIAATVFVETLTLMAVGAVISAVLVTTAVPETIRGRGWLVGLSIGFAAACLLPTTPPIARRLIARIAPPHDHTPGEPLRGLNPRLAFEGWVASIAAWYGMGASVWLAAWSVGAAGPDGWRLAPAWVLAAALPVVAGFVSLLPAGVLVREGLTLVLLSQPLGEAPALATAVAVRLIWVVSECVVSAIVYLCSGRAE